MSRRDRRDAAWREPAEVLGLAPGLHGGAGLLASRTRGAFWELLARHRLTLLVSREYEHLLVALSASGGRPTQSWLHLPHPSGIAVDRRRRDVHVASTRNPNQIHRLRAVSELMRRTDHRGRRPSERPLVPVETRHHPGCLYLHDLAFVSGALLATATGQNAVVRFGPDGSARPVWWPLSVEGRRGPGHARNAIQLNSIAAGASLRESFFTASAEKPSAHPPGSRDFRVDGHGVVFAGRRRGAPVTRGLTRPHSARLHRGRLWVANSGYGELVRCDLPGEGFEVVAVLPGWTRGLCLRGGLAFVGTSRVLRRFEHYAPGLDPSRSRCGVHAVELRSGRVLGSLEWPGGDQIFAIEAIGSGWSRGLPWTPAVDGRAAQSVRDLFYAFRRP